MNIVRCRSCGAEIVWVESRSGKLMPLDARLLMVVTEQGETVRGRQSHFASCKDAREWRKQQKINEVLDEP